MGGVAPQFNQIGVSSDEIAHKHCYKLETTVRITPLIRTSAYANKLDMNTG